MKSLFSLSVNPGQSWSILVNPSTSLFSVLPPCKAASSLVIFKDQQICIHTNSVWIKAIAVALQKSYFVKSPLNQNSYHLSTFLSLLIYFLQAQYSLVSCTGWRTRSLYLWPQLALRYTRWPYLQCNPLRPYLRLLSSAVRHAYSKCRSALTPKL